MTAAPGVPSPDPGHPAAVDPPGDPAALAAPAAPAEAVVPALATPTIDRSPARKRERAVGPMFRTAVAFTMAAIAIASASVAYYSARWASQAAASEGVALQQRAERDRTVQRINIEIAEDARLWTVYQGHWEAAAAIATEASQVRASNPSRVRVLDLDYQGHSAAMTALWPLFQGAFPQQDASGKLVFDIGAARTSLEASDQNLPVLDPDGRHVDAQGQYAHALALVLMIVMFIASLFILTIAQVFTPFARFVGAIGVGLAIGTAVQISVVDPEITPWLILAAGAALGLSLLQLLGVRLPGRFSTWFAAEAAGAEQEGAEAAEASMHGAGSARAIHEHGAPEPGIVGPDAGRDRVTRLLVVSIAAMTVVAAGIGYLQIETARAAEDQAIFAQHHALMALSTEIQGSTDAEAAIFAHVRRIETQVAAADARQQRLFWLSVGDRQRADDVGADLAAREGEAKAALAADTIAGDLAPLDYGTDPPQGDPAFPERFRLGFDEQAYMHAAMQDAANDTAALLTSRGRDYSFAVAVLAVVLYLLGLSLVLRARGLRVIFVAASAVLVLIAAAVIAPALADLGAGGAPSEAVAQQAADDYAAGLIGATTAANSTQLTTAIERLQRAVAKRPAFAEAYVALARASLSAGSPQSGSGSLSVEDPQTVELTIALLRRAKENHAETAESQLDLGFLLFRRAVQDQPLDAAVLTEGIHVTQSAIELLEPGQDDLRAIAEGNLGVAELAAGRTSNSVVEYDAALEAIGRLHGATDADDQYARERYVAGLLTDLDNLATKQPSFADAVRNAKEYIVGHVWPSTGTSAVTLSDLSIDTEFRPMLEWLAVATPKAGFDRGHVVIQWYRQDVQTGDWFVLPDVSGSTKRATVWLYPDADLGPNGFYGIGTMTASRSLHCLTSGEVYRIELYLDGRLAGEASTTVTVEPGTSATISADMAAVGARDVGLAFCAPRTWKRTLYQPGLAVAYEDPTVGVARRGIMAFRVQQPGPPLPTQDCPAGIATQAAVREVLGTDGYGPSLPALTLSETTGPAGFLDWRCLNNAYYYGSAGAGTPDQQFAYIRAIPNADGSVTVIIVMGPYSDFAKGELGLALISALLPYN